MRPFTTQASLVLTSPVRLLTAHGYFALYSRPAYRPQYGCVDRAEMHHRLCDPAYGHREGGNCKVERGRIVRPESIRYTALDRNSRREGSPGYYGWNSVWGACGKGVREVRRDA